MTRLLLVVLCDMTAISDPDPIMLNLNIDWNSIALTKRNSVARAAWDRPSHRNIAEYKYYTPRET